MSRIDSFYQKTLIAILLVISTLALYWQVSGFDFVGYDDSLYVSLASKRITWESFVWSFTTLDFANWHPLTWISLILDYNLYGSNAGGYHVTNLIFHTLNTLLLFFLLNRTTGTVYRSAFVAVLFALHPLHVESVAWVSERKDVLSTFLGLWALWAYVSYVHKPKASTYLPVILLFCLSLMAKPMLVTLPFVFLLMDYWPLNRFAFQLKTLTNNNKFEPRLYPFLLEKLPFFMLSLASSIITFIAQNNYKAVISLEHASLSHRLLNAFMSYAGYLKKTFWFHDLSIFYPYPASINLLETAPSILCITSITIISIALIRKAPYFPVGWFWFLGTLVPVIGIVQVGFQAMSERYTYIPLIGIFIVISWGLRHLLQNIRYGQVLFAFSAFIFIFISSLATYHQIGIWKNNISLFSHVLKFNPRDHIAHHIIGHTMETKGEYAEALHYYSIVLKLNPVYAPAYINTGNVLVKLNRLDEALHCYDKALQINDRAAEAAYNIGIIMLLKNNPETAINYFDKALKIRPDDADTHNNMGVALMKSGNINKALYFFQKAQRLNPHSQEVKKNIAIAIREMANRELDD